MMRLVIIIILLFGINAITIASSIGTPTLLDTITRYQLQLLLNGPKTHILIKNKVIVSGPDDSRLIGHLFPLKGKFVYVGAYKLPDTNRVTFENCNFYRTQTFFAEGNVIKFSLINCKSGNTIFFLNCNMRMYSQSSSNINFLFFESSINEMKIIESQQVVVGVWKTKVLRDVLLANCKINSINLIESEVGRLSVSNCEFLDDNERELSVGVSIKDSDIKHVVLSKLNIGSMSLKNTQVSHSFTVDSFAIKRFISMYQSSLPPQTTNLSWDIIAGNKLCYFINDTTLFNQSSPLYSKYHYDELVNNYKQFLDIYKVRGDIESANACYIEMKDLETKRKKYVYENEGGVSNWLMWQLNVFLKFFAEYGTSPVRSIIVSFWVVLIFAGFYFFTYSEWDKIDRAMLMSKSNKMIHYFKSEQRLEDFYSEDVKEEFESYQKFKNNIKESKEHLPFFFNVLLKPLYHIAQIKHTFKSWSYRRMEILSGRWIDLSNTRKIVVGTTVLIGLMGYLGYLFIVRSLNSLILSLNTFTTLGFGEIPVTGLSRYVAILEGFLGWFLLSIFSVSLIGQILQS